MPPIRSTARSRSSRRGRSRPRSRSATARSAPPPIRRCWRGSISSRARGSRSAPPPSRSARRLTSEPDKLAGGIGFGPRLLVSEAALRATGLLQPGSLVRWHYRAAAARQRRQRRRRCRPSSPRPPRRNCRKPAGRSAPAPTPRPRSSECRALHAISDAGRADRAAGRRRRRRERGQEPPRSPARRDRDAEIARRDRLARVRDLSHAGAWRSRRSARCPGSLVGAALPFLIAWAFGAVLPLPLAPAHPSGRPRARAALRPADRARLRAVAARARARRAGLGAVSRRGGERPSAGRAGPTSWRPCWWCRRSTTIAIDARLRPAHRVDLRGRGGRRVRAAAAGRGAADVDRAPPAAGALAGRAARDRQHPPAGRAHAERRAVARAWARAARHRDRDRRQPAPAVPGGAARQGAVVLFRRHPVRRGGEIRRLHPRARARARCSTACRCCAGASCRRTAFRPKSSSRRPTPPGRCKATAASPTRTRSRPARASSPANGGSRTTTGRRWSRSRSGSRTGIGLKLGDPIVVNVLGRNLTATVANLRTLDWQSLGINFVMVFSPNTLPRRAAHPYRHADLSGRQHRRRGDRAAQGGGRGVPDRHRGAGARGDRCLRQHPDQPGARHPRRERPHPAGGRAGARRRAGGRSPPPRLRRRHPQDGRRNARAAPVGLCDRISGARARHRRVRGRGRLRGRGVRRHPGS